MKIDRDGKLNLNTLFLGLYLSLFSMIDIELAKTKKYLNHEIESVRRKTILTSTLKKYISTFAVCIMVAVVFSSVVYSNVKAEIKGTQPPENNAWIISNETYVGNETLVMNDDIIITETGKLTLFNCILEMNCSINGSYYIEVQNGGIFNLMYSKVTNGTINASYDFYFANGSNGLIHRSIIEKAGYQGGGSKGIKVESNNLTIFESIIQNCYNGIWAEKSAPIIINSTIRENLENGIYWESGCKLWEDQFQDLSKTSELVNAQIISKNIFLKYNEYTTDSNTEALIHLNDGIGSTATDSSGNGNSGTITGAQWTGDNLLGDYALYFDGSDRVNFGDEFDLTDGSIEMWFNLTENFNNSCTDDMMLYSKYMIQGGKEYSVKLKLEADDGKIYFNITKQDNQYSIYSNSVSWMNNTWYHVAGTWGSNGMKMYINNTLQLNTNSYNDYWGNKNSEAYLGIFYDETSYLNGFEGIIDEFRVSDIQRTDFIDYVSQGNLVSVTIPSNLFNKRTLLNISKTEPDSNHYITLSIYDGNNKLIPGFENLVGENIDISSISPNEYPILKLKANLYGNGDDSPILHYWRIEGTTTIYNNIFEKNKVGIYLNKASPTILKNDFRNNFEVGIKVIESQPMIVQNNISSNGLSDGIYLQESYPILIYNNIWDCDDAISVIDALTFADGETIRNNTVPLGVNKDRDLYFIKDAPPEFINKNTTIIKVPNPKYTGITNIIMKVEGLPAEYNGWHIKDWNVDNGPVNTNQQSPSIVADNSGNVYVSWADTRNSNYDIYLNKFVSGNWGTSDIRVDDTGEGTSNQNSPSMTMDDPGNIYVVWEDNRNGNYDIYFSKSQAGESSFEENIRVDDTGISTYHQSNPSVAIDNQGNIFVVWADYRNGNSDIYFSKSTDGGITFDTNLRVNDASAQNDQENPSIDVDSSDNIYVVWEDNRNGNFDIYFSKSTDGGSSFTTDVKINDDSGTTFQQNPDIALNSTDKIFVVWNDKRNGNFDIYSSKSTNGGTSFRTNIRVDDTGNDYSDQLVPNIIIDDRDYIHTTWMDDRIENNYDIYYTNSTDSGSSFAINNKVNSLGYDKYFQGNPSISVENTNYNISVVWADKRSGKYDVYYNRYLEENWRDYPEDPFLCIGNEDDIIWSYQGEFNKRENVSNFASRLNDYLINYGNSPGEYISVPLTFYSNESGRVNITNISIVYDFDPQIMVENNITDCDVGLYLEDTSPFQTYRNEMNSVNIPVKCVNSNATIEDWNFTDIDSNYFYLTQESHIFVLDTPYVRDKSFYLDSNSDVSFLWYLNLKVIDTDETPLSGKLILILGRKGEMGKIKRTDNNGLANNIICKEVTIKSGQNGRTYYTPHNITIMDSGNNISFMMDASQELKIYHGNDSDNDSIPDELENNFNVFWYEAEHHVVAEEQIKSEYWGIASNYQSTLTRDNSIQIINDYFSIPNRGEYQCYIRARKSPMYNADNNTWLSISIDDEISETLLIDEDMHLMTDDYRWYSTPNFETTGKYFKMTIDQELSEVESVNVDRIVFVRIKDGDDNPTTAIIGQITNPVDPDSDFDWLKDTLEVRNGTYWWEGEHNVYYSEDDQIIDDYLASNSKAVKYYGGGGETIEIITTPPKGTYRYYVKARRMSELESTASWQSDDEKYTNRIAWGDMDGDGDLDLAVANENQQNAVYLNKGGTIQEIPYWESAVTDMKCTKSVAWGDVDNDGDLDLAAGNYGEPNVIYYNYYGMLDVTPTIIDASVSDNTKSLDWGDIDNDGDLDLAVGNYQTTAGPKTRIYTYDWKTNVFSLHWESTYQDGTNCVAFGDIDNDGDLDLAVGNSNSQKNRIYLNTNGNFPSSSDWNSAEMDATFSIALGDVDNDGDLDLAVGNYLTFNRVYYNNNGVLESSPSWNSSDYLKTQEVCWGDMNGDGFLDLAVCNDQDSPTDDALVIYLNDKGTLESSPYWTTSIYPSTSMRGLAWGDIDNDNDLDLAIGIWSTIASNRIFLNSEGNMPSLSMKLRVTGQGTNLPDEKVHLTSQYQWYKTDDFNVTGFIILHGIDYTLSGKVMVDRVLLVNVTQIENDKLFDSGTQANVTQKTLTFTSGNENNSDLNFRVPEGSDLTAATFEIEGQTNSSYDVFLGSDRNLIAGSEMKYPAIYGDIIVFVNYSCSYPTIYLYNLSNPSQGSVKVSPGTVTANQENPAIWGNKIVWDDWRNDDDDCWIYDGGTDGENDCDIYMYDLITEEETQITSDDDDSQQNCSDIYENKIVWTDYRNDNEYYWTTTSTVDNNNGDIYMLDLGADGEKDDGVDEEVHLVDGPQNSHDPAIYNNKVVWVDNRNDNDGVDDTDIFIYDISKTAELLYEFDINDPEFKLTKIEAGGQQEDTTSQSLPDIYGDKIVWRNIDDLTGELIVYDYTTNIMRKIKNSGIDYSLAIYGDKIVFDSSGMYGEEIRVYDNSRDIMKTVISTDIGYSDMYPAIYKDKIVWQEEITGGGTYYEIHILQQYYSIDIGNNSGIDWEHSEIFTKPERTTNLAMEINEYLNSHEDTDDSYDDGYIHVPLKIYSKYKGELKIANIEIEYECLTDPLDADTDGDGINDGYEYFGYFGYDILELEDAVEVMEWEYSPISMFHQTGLTLTSSNDFENDADLNHSENSWAKLRTKIKNTGNYKLIMDPEPTSVIKGGSFGGAQSLRQTDPPRPPKVSAMGGEVLPIGPEMAEYVLKLIANSTYVIIEKEGGEIIEPEPGSLKFQPYLQKIKLGANEGVDYNDTKVQIYCWLSFSGKYNFTQNTNYSIKVGIDIDLLKLKPELSHNGSEAPPDVPWTDVMLLQIIDLDFIRVEKQRLDPLSTDTDEDTLLDGFEADFFGYPLNPDVDGDGLNDAVELFSTKTNMFYRDSDLDGIRDGVELGLSIQEIQAMNANINSPGSWIERYVHSEDHTPFDYTPINNWDYDWFANPSGPPEVTNPLKSDSDEDGLPDGWIDGWTYKSELIDFEDTSTYNSLLQYKSIKYGGYDVDNWCQGGIVDYKIQIYEGEDLNLNGHCESYDDPDDWSFFSDTYEPFNHVDFNTGRFADVYQSNPAGETNPSNEDSDYSGGAVVGDEIPDGYEVWYSHLDPIRIYDPIAQEYDYILNPIETQDAYYDYDIDPEIFEYFDPSKDAWHEVDETFYAWAKKIEISPHTPSYYPITRVELFLNLSKNSDTHITFEIWDDHEWMKDPPDPLNPHPIELLYTTTTTGRGWGWYGFDIPSSIIAYMGDIDPIMDGDQYPVSSDLDDKYYRNSFSKRTPTYFLAVRYVEPDKTSAKDYEFKWGTHQSQTEDIWKQDTGAGPDWYKSSSKRKLSYRLIGYNNNINEITQYGDYMVNLREFIVGTDPKSDNTDEWIIGTEIYNDGLMDGIEVGYDISDPTETEPLYPSIPCPRGGVIFQTNVKDGARKFDFYGEKTSYIHYDGDGEGTQISGYIYDFDTTIINPPKNDLCVYPYEYQKSRNVLLFTLQDGTMIYMSPDTQKQSGKWTPGSKIYIWEPNTNLARSYNFYDSENKEWYKGVDGTCHIFTRGTTINLDTAYPDTDFRNQQIYLSNPWSFDTDIDGITDGLERTQGLSLSEWKLESEALTINDGNVLVDTLINVRDQDSDNDGIYDAAEIAWMIDSDSDNYLNIADWDSDDDKLKDGDEVKYYNNSDWDGQDKYIKWVDNDLDGFDETPVQTTEEYAEYKYESGSNMLDVDSDNDEIKDGPEAEPYIIYDNLGGTKIHSRIILLDDGSNKIDGTLSGVTSDNGDNIYFFDNSVETKKLKKLKSGYSELDYSGNPSNNDNVTLLTSLSNPKDLAVDKFGNIYFTDGTNLKKLPHYYKEDGTAAENNEYNTNILETIDTGLNNPIGITVDSQGYVYYIDQSSPDSYIMKYNPVNDSSYKILELTDTFYGITIDKIGNIYFTTTSKVMMLPKNYNDDDYEDNDELVKTLLNSLTNVKHIDVDGEGNIHFIANNKIQMLSKSFYEDYPVLNDYFLKEIYTTDTPAGIAVSKDKHIFYTDSNNGDDLIKLPYAKTNTIWYDSDGDGLADGFDILEGGNIRYYGELLSGERPLSEPLQVNQTVRTNQLDWDTDGDSLADGSAEICTSYSDQLNKWYVWWFKIENVSTKSWSKGTVSEKIWIKSDPTKNDTDDDLLLDTYESWYSNPCNNDTDGDGILDGIEDSNRNGILEVRETNLLDKDTDDDRLPDGWIDGVVDSNGDDVIDESDADGVRDYWEGEDLNCNGKITNDTDNDRIWDDGEIWDKETNPIVRDTDGDSIADGDEIYYNLSYQSGSRDDINTDGVEGNDESLDGNDQNTIIDYWETAQNGRGYLDLDGDGFINPLDSDSDGDGISDYFENIDHDGKLDGMDSFEDIVKTTGNIKVQVWSRDDWSGDYKLYLPNGDDTNAVLSIGPSGEYIANFYQNSKNITISEKEMLYIEEDLVLKFHDYKGFVVNGGNLSIYGKTNEQVILDKTDNSSTGYWNGFEIKNTNNTEIIDCEISNAKHEDHGASIYCDNSSIQIFNNEIEGNDVGIGIYSVNSAPEIASNEIHEYYHSIKYIKNSNDKRPDHDAIIVGNDIHHNHWGVTFNDNDYTSINISKNNIRNQSGPGIQKSISAYGQQITYNFIAGNNGAWPYEHYVYPYNEGSFYQLVNCFNKYNVTEKYQITPENIWDNYYFILAYETNPYDNDTDDDCILDEDDLHNYDNNNISEWNCDYDGDGLINAMDMDSDDDSFFGNWGDRFEDDNDGDGDKEIATDHNGIFDKDTTGETNPLDEDTDDDGIRDGEEVFWGLDPNDADTDDDGVRDGAEIFWKCDIDGDGLINAKDPDSDGDGLQDGTELGLNDNDKTPDTGPSFKPDEDNTTTTNPLDPDTDDDSLSDGNGEDTDCDGKVDSGESDPLDKDTDDDGIMDGTEILIGYDIDPTDPDSDDDGILDGVERGYTLTDITIDTDLEIFSPDADPSTKTEPDNDDTDDDGLEDGEEDSNCDGAIDGDTDKDERIDYRDDSVEGIPGEVWTETNPGKEDSDGDGLLDGYDIEDSSQFSGIYSDGTNYWGELSYVNHDIDPRGGEKNITYQKEATDPLNRDTDGDLLWDGQNVSINKGELAIHYSKKHYYFRWETPGVDNGNWTIGQKIYTDPSNPDSDNDGLIDGLEVKGWILDIIDGVSLKIINESSGRQVYSNPTVIDTDGDNHTTNFNTSDFDEFSYRSDPESKDTDEDYIYDWYEDAVSINQIEGEKPKIGKIRGSMDPKWPSLFEMYVKLKLTIPVSDNAGLDNMVVSVSSMCDFYWKPIYFYGDKEKTIEVSFKVDMGGYVFSGFDVDVDLFDMNGRKTKGDTHFEGIVEKFANLLLSILITAATLAIAFLGSTVIPIIMGACAITIGIAVGVIIGSLDKYVYKISNAVKNIEEDNSDGIIEDNIINKLSNVLNDKILMIAFGTLSIALSILFLCLKPYTSVGDWVMVAAINLAISAALCVFGGSDQGTESPENSNTDLTISDNLINWMGLDLSGSIGSTRGYSGRSNEDIINIIQALIAASIGTVGIILGIKGLTDIKLTDLLGGFNRGTLLIWGKIISLFLSVTSLSLVFLGYLTELDTDSESMEILAVIMAGIAGIISIIDFKIDKWSPGLEKLEQVCAAFSVASIIFALVDWRIQE